MKNKLLPAIIILIFLSTLFAGIVLSKQNDNTIDTVTLNDIRAEVEGNTADYSKIDSLGFDIIVIDFVGTVKYSYTEMSEKSYDEWINYAYQNDCAIMDYTKGKIFIFRAEDNSTNIVILTISLFSALIVLLLVLYNFYIQNTMFKPFHRLKDFAATVATGNLDSPLPMDKNNMFGAFSESFDLMRSELKKAKEKEIQLEKDKKQLIAQLSHDIKTPLSSIKAVLEVLKLNETDGKKLGSIAIVQRKSSEIDTLITDLFNSTLQDMTELKINLDEVSSKEIDSIIKEADYLNKIQSVEVPDCLVSADMLRLAQTVGNIINNSYKYADTDILLTAEITDSNLSLEVRDFGKGVADEELPLIINKFYRGSNSEKIGGTGLGLYICKLITQRMGGNIDCYNTENGFAVKICLKLA